MLPQVENFTPDLMQWVVVKTQVHQKYYIKLLSGYVYET